MEAEQSKVEWRKRLAARRAELTVARRAQHARSIADHLLTLPAFHAAPCIGLYAAIGAEVSTTLLACAARRLAKEVCYPRVLDAEARSMEFALVTTEADLLPGYGGVVAPPPVAPVVPPEKIACLCLPGVGFDPRGVRLGRGAGYYDRWLATYLGYRIGLAFACQVVTRLPCEVWDQRIDVIVTEERVICCRRSA